MRATVKRPWSTNCFYPEDSSFPDRQYDPLWVPCLHRKLAESDITCCIILTEGEWENLAPQQLDVFGLFVLSLFCIRPQYVTASWQSGCHALQRLISLLLVSANVRIEIYFSAVLSTRSLWMKMKQEHIDNNTSYHHCFECVNKISNVVFNRNG